MKVFLIAHGLEILFGTIAAITSIVAVYFARRSLKLNEAQVFIDNKRSVHFFFTREAMIKYLAKMYDNSEQGDTIWFQTVGMSNYPGNVQEKILEVAGRGVSFKMIFNKNNPSLKEFIQLFDPIKNATYKLAIDNRIRVQGLSTKEVIIAFPTLTRYTAIRFTDKAFIEIIFNWFENRFSDLKSEIYE